MSDITLDFNEFNYIIIYIAVALFIFIVKTFFQDFFKNIQHKTKRNEFVKFLRSNKSINNYIIQYEKIDFFRRKYAIMYTYIGMFFGFLIPLLSLLLLSYIQKSSDNELTNELALMLFEISIAITLSLSSILILVITQYINSNVINESEKYIFFANIFTLIEFYVFFSYIPVLLFVFLILSNLSLILYKEFLIAQLLILCELIFLFTFPFFVFYQKQYFKSLLKNNINLKGSKFFPYLNVRIKDNCQIDGRIKDIFDEKLLILEDNGKKKVTLWESVYTLEVSEGKIKDLESQKTLEEFN